MSFTKKQELAIKALKRVLERFAALDLSIFVTGDVYVRRGPIEMNDIGLVDQDDVEWVSVIVPGLHVDGGDF